MLILCLFKFMNMNNLQSGLLFSLTGITAVASLSSCASQKKTEEQKPYNIVYIMTDDHTAQMMSCYDKRYMETPNLDRIANDGVRFTNSFVANSLSGPSRACMITGKHSCANKFYDNTTCIFDGSQQTFPKLLQQAGYQTALIGKWHLESLPTGFNYWEIVPGQGDYYNPDFITQDNDTIQKHGYITNIITDDAIDWMENKRDTTAHRCNDSKWFAQMSLPREVSVKNGRLYQTPIKELDAMRKDRVEYNDVVIDNDAITLDKIEGRTIDMELVIRPEDKENVYKKFVLRFAQNEKFYTELSFRPDESVLKIDRKFSGTERALVHQRRCLVNGDANELKLRVILDRFSAEIFINDGKQVMSAVIFTEQEAKGISFFAEGAAKIDIVKYNLV